MIRRIEDLPENMIGFRASGEVTKDDLDQVIKEVDNHMKSRKKLNYMLELQNSPADFTMGAWWKDALLGLKNFREWNRAAIVSDMSTVRKFTDLASMVMPGVYRGFELKEFDTAVKWVSEGIE